MNNNEPKPWPYRWSRLKRRWPIILTLVIAAVLPLAFGEPLSWTVVLIWGLTYLAVGLIAVREDGWGEIGRGFLSTRMGSLVNRACTRVMTRLMGTGRSAIAVCQVLTTLIGQAVYLVYDRWIRPREYPNPYSGDYSFGDEPRP